MIGAASTFDGLAYQSKAEPCPGDHPRFGAAQLLTGLYIIQKLSILLDQLVHFACHVRPDSDPRGVDQDLRMHAFLVASVLCGVLVCSFVSLKFRAILGQPAYLRQTKF